jgi:IclR family transcriptional regulator, KDG regulon repressor
MPTNEVALPMLTTLDKGLRVLEALSEAEPAPATLTALSNAVGLHRTTVFRILGTLRARGYVSRDEAGDGYRLGVRILTLASSVLHDLDIREAARPALEELRRRTRELVILSVLDRHEVVTIERLDSDQTLALRAQLGSRRPLHCTAAGKAFMAHLPARELDAALGGELASYTPRTVTLAGEIRRQLAEVERTGFAWDDEEYLEGVRCVAAPVFGIEGGVVGVVSLAAPTVRTPWERLWRLGADVRLAADAISRRLGAPPRPGAAPASEGRAPAGRTG